MKRKVEASPPKAAECPQCTTPRLCGTLEWKDKKGPKCVGKSNGPDKCDCLNDCGDDPWLKDGRALPCEGYLQLEQQAAADALWAGLQVWK